MTNTQILAKQGQTTVYTTMAESVAHKIQDLRKETTRGLFSNFSEGSARLIPVALVRGVEYIDDAPADNVNAVWFALESMYKPVVWIIEGNGKVDISSLETWIDKKVKTIIHIGKGTDLVQQMESIAYKYVQVNNIEEAVKMAYLHSQDGQSVLYAPLFKAGEEEDLKARSNKFRKVVNEL